MSESTWLEMLAGVAVMAGHNWPVFLGLRGGRGAATAVGVLLATLPYLAIPICALTLVILYFSKRSVPCLALLFISIPVLAWPVGYPSSLAAYSLGLAFFAGASHYLSTHLRPYSGPPEPDQKAELPLPPGIAILRDRFIHLGLLPPGFLGLLWTFPDSCGPWWV